MISTGIQMLLGLCLAALATAMPADPYTYAPPQQVTVGGINTINPYGISVVTGSTSQGTEEQIRRQQQVKQVAQIQQQARTHIIDEINTVFYTFTAPAQQFVDPTSNAQSDQINRRNVQVIFIHAPEQPSLNDAFDQYLKLKQQQQTNIYVLTKQLDLSDLRANFERQESNASPPPQVHFIKYDTAEEAERSKEAIRAEFSRQKGNTFDGGVAVANVIDLTKSSSAISDLTTSNAASASHQQALGQIAQNTPTYTIDSQPVVVKVEQAPTGRVISEQIKVPGDNGSSQITYLPPSA